MQKWCVRVCPLARLLLPGRVPAVAEGGVGGAAAVVEGGQAHGGDAVEVVVRSKTPRVETRPRC